MHRPWASDGPAQPSAAAASAPPSAAVASAPPTAPARESGRAAGDRAERHELRPGDVVRIRDAAHILATLDASARLDGMPFMPEMLPLCGQVGRVLKRADKTCDNNWAPGMRRLEHAVFLWGLRCDGGAHGGCQAGCQFFWKEEWLARVRAPDGRDADGHDADGRDADGRDTDGRDTDGRESVPAGSPVDAAPIPVDAAPIPADAGRAPAVDPARPRCTLEDVVRAATVATGPDGELYACQATEIRRATAPLPWWDLRQYVRDLWSGNVGIRRMATGLPRQAMADLAEVVARHRAPRPRRPAAHRPPLDLRPGDRVRVRSRPEIEATLDATNRERGLAFNAEMYSYCGGEYRVLRRLERIIHEPSGRMIRLKDCVVLDGVVCLGDYHLFCARGVYPYWREAWLERLG